MNGAVRGSGSIGGQLGKAQIGGRIRRTETEQRGQNGGGLIAGQNEDIAAGVEPRMRLYQLRAGVCSEREPGRHRAVARRSKRLRRVTAGVVEKENDACGLAGGFKQVAVGLVQRG